MQQLVACHLNQPPETPGGQNRSLHRQTLSQANTLDILPWLSFRREEGGQHDPSMRYLLTCHLYQPAEIPGGQTDTTQPHPQGSQGGQANIFLIDCAFEGKKTKKTTITSLQRNNY